MKRLLYLTLIAALILSSLLSLGLGSARLGLDRIFAAIRGEDHTAAVIIWELRLPRLLAALLAGVGLASAGLILQTVTDNRLCAPNIIGVNSGAGLAVMALLALAPGLWRMLPAAAFVGALAATLTTLTIAKASGSGSRSTLVLAGVAVSALMNAGISFLSMRFPDLLTSYTAFSVGGFDAVSTGELLVPAAVIALSLIGAFLLAPKLALLGLGDDSASSLGISVARVRTLSVVLASALCAAVVSFAGLLGFVGLTVPHIARGLLSRVARDDRVEPDDRTSLRSRIASRPSSRSAVTKLRELLVLSMLLGALIALLSDLVGRVVFAPSELPAGVIMSLLGAPFFIFLLIGGGSR